MMDQMRSLLASALALYLVAAPPALAQRDTGAVWPTYRHDPQRSGFAPGPYDPASIKQVWESDPLDGQVYAQPIVVGGRVFVATENNSVYALDPSSGQVLWMQHLGDPVPRSMLPCGNIDP